MIPLMKFAFLNEYDTKRALAEFIVQTPRLSMDVKCSEFEREFAKVQKRKHAVLFNSGSSANLATLQALKNLDMLANGDKVGYSALTWATNVMPIIQLGMVPVPVDCNPSTLNVMAELLEVRHRSVPLKAMFITNALGFTGDLSKIKEFCAAQGIILLEDNCEALGTELPEGKAGNFGVAGTFSFFVAHHMSTIEGGMAVTDNEDIAEMLRIVRANGWDRNLSALQQQKWRKRYGLVSEFEAKYSFYDLAYNMRPTEITGFLGLFQLRFLRETILKRQENYLRLERAMRQNTELLELDHSHISLLSSFALPVVCKTPSLRKKYLEQFAGAGVEVRPMIAGNMQKQPFYRKYVRIQVPLPSTEVIDACGFYCGNYPELTEQDLETLTSCLGEA